MNWTDNRFLFIIGAMIDYYYTNNTDFVSLAVCVSGSESLTPKQKEINKIERSKCNQSKRANPV